MKKVFTVVTFVLGVTLVAMWLTKPEPKEHYDVMIGVAQNVVDQKVTSDNVKKTMEKLGADLDLTEVTELGKGLAMNTAGAYLQSNMKVEDYYVVTMGTLNCSGVSLPVTFGILGQVFLLIDEGQVKQMLR